MANPTDKIRICFISPKAYPLFNPAVTSVFGGAEVDLYLLATELARDKRYEVSFLVADYGQPAEETREGVRLIRTVNFAANPVKGVWQVWRGLKRANGAIYVHEAASPGTVIAGTFCRRNRRALVYRTASQRECDGRYRKDKPLESRLFYRAVRQAAAVIVQSGQDQQNLRQTESIESSVIANAHRMTPQTQAPKNRVVWVGRSEPVKRPDLFIKLAEQLPQIHFVMVCQKATNDGNYQALRQQVAAIGNMEFVERVPFTEMDRFMEPAAVLVNTSDSEGFPNVFIHAAKAGAAILSLNVNPDNFLHRHQCGQCLQGDFEALVQVTGRMMADGSYLPMGRNGRRYVQEQHDIERIIVQYKELFEKLAR